MFNVKSLVNSMCHELENLRTEDDVRNTATYQALLRLHSILEKSGIPSADAAKIASRLKIEMNPRFHLDYPEEFNRIVESFGRVLVLLHDTVKKDFGTIEVFLEMVSAMNLRMQY
jgi:hypothetical protein